jgi:hypothetical protein
MATVRLAEELALLDTASRALERRQLPRVLRALADHERRFPDGALRQERQGLRLIALCELAGAAATAEHRRDEFLRAAPDSPLAARLRRACGSER